MATALAATLLAAWGAGFLHWRPQLAGAPAGGELRAVTFNVARGHLGTPEKVASALRAADADLLLLQETNFTRPGFGDELLARLPGYAVRRGHEVMTLSRLPVLGAVNHPAPGSRRTFLETRVRWQGRELRVVNAHLGTVLVSSALRGDLATLRRTRDVRAAQVARLADLAGRAPGPLLLGGDLNTPPRGQVFRQLRRAFGPGAHDLAGRGPGWTFSPLRLRIDHLLARGLTPTRAQVLPDAGSDHRPLLAGFRLADRDAASPASGSLWSGPLSSGPPSSGPR
ncbi:endonuclease/exonuclease/phosphatase family protein [Deinococcus budaensis]|uniref:Vancomycin resistance protein VanJ n=1 Tax=Deinococcus budaensis TaxID=1665626 RepID=A0A7W8GFW5_9DEIO|nr:vancomycin resistance protein VanJ [Deinococcus budaensis]